MLLQAGALALVAIGTDFATWTVAVADLWGIPAAIWVVAALTAASGLVVAARMYETHPRSIR